MYKIASSIKSLTLGLTAEPGRNACIFIYLVGLSLRYYFVFGKNINLDEASFMGYLSLHDPNSVYWANYPPLFLTILKSINIYSQYSIQFLKTIIFGISLLSYSLFYGFLIKRRYPALSLIFWTIFPASLVVGTQLNPSTLAELLAVVIFCSLCPAESDRETSSRPVSISNLLTTIFATIGLLLTSYSNSAFLVFWSLNYFLQTRKIRPFLLLTATGALAIYFSYNNIRWQYLEWIHASDWQESIQASIIFLRNLVGYSWLGLILFVFLVIAANRKTLSHLLLTTCVLVLSMNLLFSLKASEPRFLVFLIPWIAFIFSELCRHLPTKFGWAKWGLLTVVLATSIDTLWFARMQRSGFSSLVSHVKTDKIVTLYTSGIPGITTQFFPATVTIVRSPHNTIQCCEGCALARLATDGKVFPDLSQDFHVVETEVLDQNSIEKIQYVRFTNNHCAPH